MTAQAADHLDAARFEAALSAASEEPDLETRLARLDEALGLWTGDALLELADSPQADAEAIRPKPLRLRAQILRFEALLDLGRHGETIPVQRSLACQERTRAVDRGFEAMCTSSFEGFVDRGVVARRGEGFEYGGVSAQLPWPVSVAARLPQGLSGTDELCNFCEGSSLFGEEGTDRLEAVCRAAEVRGVDEDVESFDEILRSSARPPRLHRDQRAPLEVVGESDPDAECPQ